MSCCARTRAGESKQTCRYGQRRAAAAKKGFNIREFLAWYPYTRIDFWVKSTTSVPIPFHQPSPQRFRSRRGVGGGVFEPRSLLPTLSKVQIYSARGPNCHRYLFSCLSCHRFDSFLSAFLCHSPLLVGARWAARVPAGALRPGGVTAGGSESAGLACRYRRPSTACGNPLGSFHSNFELPAGLRIVICHAAWEPHTAGASSGGRFCDKPGAYLLASKMPPSLASFRCCLIVANPSLLLAVLRCRYRRYLRRFWDHWDDATTSGAFRVPSPASPIQPDWVSPAANTVLAMVFSPLSSTVRSVSELIANTRTSLQERLARVA